MGDQIATAPRCVVPSIICKKRIHAELKRWEEEDISSFLYNPTNNTAIFSFCVIDIPVSYPFDAPCPRMGGKKRITGPLDPISWALCIMTNPKFLQIVPSWNTNCLCCSSVTCFWNPSKRMSNVAREILFDKSYLEMTAVVPSLAFFSSLPTDVIENMALVTYSECKT